MNLANNFKLYSIFWIQNIIHLAQIGKPIPCKPKTNLPKTLAKQAQDNKR
jgi:hypothetical protein